MPTVTITPNMNLLSPIVGIDPGPQYAIDIDSTLTIIDRHDHSPGNGVQITPLGMNISSDLAFNNNNLISARSLRLQIQSAPLGTPTDLTELYAVTNTTAGSDLYFNDGNGTQIPLTINGVISGTPGSINNLIPPANVTYSSVSETYVFQSAVATGGNIDGASITIRDQVANSNGVTLAAPASLGANYTLTLPTALPSSSAALVVDSSGNVTARIGAFMPTASVIPYAGASAPAGWLLANGQSVSTTTFAALFSIIGYTYGGGGSVFSVPNMLNNVPIGAGSSYTLGSTGGEATHVLTISEMPTHTHPNTFNDPGHIHNFVASERTDLQAGGTSGALNNTGNTPTDSSLTGATITNVAQGGGAAHNNIQPFLALNYIIKT